MLSDSDILKKYNAELQSYANVVVQPLENYLEKERQPYQPFLKRLFDFYLFSSYLLGVGLIPKEDKNKPLGILFVKASLTFYGVYTSLQNGLVTEASTSLRSLFEAYLNIKLILQEDTETRLRLYDNFAKVERWNNFQANLRLVEEGKLTKEDFAKTFNPELIEKTKAEYEEVKTDYHPTRPYHWAWKVYSATPKDRNPSISFIAKHLKLDLDYVKVYSSLSISVHNSPSVINLVSNGHSISLAPKFSEMISTIGGIALDYIIKIIEVVVEHLRFREPNEIKVYMDNFILAVMDEAEKGAT